MKLNIFLPVVVDFFVTVLQYFCVNYKPINDNDHGEICVYDSCEIDYASHSTDPRSWIRGWKKSSKGNLPKFCINRS